MRNSFADVGMALVFGVLGYLMAKLGVPDGAARAGADPHADAGERAAPVARHGARQPAIFLTRPVALILIGAGVALTTWTLVSRQRR